MSSINSELQYPTIKTFDTHSLKDFSPLTKVKELRAVNKELSKINAVVNILTKKKVRQHNTTILKSVPRFLFHNEISNLRRVDGVLTKSNFANYESANMNDSEINSMVASLSKSSLSEVWDNSEDEFWDDYYKTLK